MNKISVFLASRDNKLIEFISDFLLEKGLEVIKLKEKEKFLNKIEKTKPDIILVDVEKLEIKPLHFCKTLRRKFPYIPQIVIPESTDTAFMTKFVKIPVEDFVTKPIDPELLYVRINANTDKKNYPDKIYRNGNITIDIEKKQVLVDEEPVEVTPTEYKLLRYLVDNTGKVLSRDKILNHVWGYDAYVIDRNVDVYVGYLRDKLKSKGKNSIIKTVPSFGYMMTELKEKKE